MLREVHRAPDNAPSDGPNMVKLSDLAALLQQMQELDQVRLKYEK